jgi:hypothetical protein
MSAKKKIVVDWKARAKKLCADLAELNFKAQDQIGIRECRCCGMMLGPGYPGHKPNCLAMAVVTICGEE